MLKNHILFRTFCELKGNPKISICTEPLWFIPYSLFIPFQTLYMRKLGLSSMEIGTTVSVGLVLQVVFALLGGVITDKMGRRKATVIFDTLGWSVPCVIWAFSQNYQWFLIAAAVNAAFQITNTSWNCLFIEDCPSKHITNAFTLIQLCGMLSAFFAPISMVLVSRFDVVPVMRWLYGISAVSMLIKFLILYWFGTETKTGERRMRETRDLSYCQMLRGYGTVCRTILRTSRMRLVVYIMALTNILLLTTNNFFSLYITEQKELPDAMVAVFPVLRTVVMLVFVLGLQQVLQMLNMRQSFLIGFIIYIVSHVLLLLSPRSSLLLIIGYTVLEAAAYAIVIPRKDALMAHYVDDQERSRIYALYNVLMIALSAPFGTLLGWLYDLRPDLPFLFNIGVFFATIGLIVTSKDLRQDALLR